jgi:hypothetical protein
LGLVGVRDRREHSIVQGTGWQITPWGAVQGRVQALHRGRYWSDDPQVL